MMHLAQTFCRHLFTHLITLYAATEFPSVMTTEQKNQNDLSDIERMGLRYTAGAIVRKARKQAKKMLNEDEYEKFISCITKRTATKNSEKFTATINRGGLCFVSEPCFLLFLRLEKLAEPSYTNVLCEDRLQLVLNIISEDSEVNKLWQGMVGKNEKYSPIFKTIITTFLTNQGNLAVRILKEKNEKKIHNKKLDKEK